MGTREKKSGGKRRKGFRKKRHRRSGGLKKVGGRARAKRAVDNSGSPGRGNYKNPPPSLCPGRKGEKKRGVESPGISNPIKKIEKVQQHSSKTEEKERYAHGTEGGRGAKPARNVSVGESWMSFTGRRGGGGPNSAAAAI